MTQCEMVLAHLKEFGEITDLDAYREYAIRRLSAVIYNLRRDGYEIETKDTIAKNRYGKSVKFATYILKN